ncbi:sulfate reduction electron transfer complex DsrMKJOP subunit DsrO [Dehalobacterium formicoaceticum]|uniref:sulfate reduction electron transfer complex DsrMKJOP subunit DsrO n=1 Tax=Dehalobacterium formicoaceticum TaxID=51515 RepID=UPI000B7D4457|nr:4Fe-4S dicluster domain-containing protein [Dehalobacterium formicoaceticum]
MKLDRRNFIRMCGVGILGLGAAKADKIFAQVGSGKYQSTVTSDGKRWAMVIDTKKCENCDDCIAACHKGHNVPEIKPKEEEIKWIWKEDFEHSFPGLGHERMSQELMKRPFLLLCNHCENPACVRVCPTKATFKRGDGVVMMDYHRCIGCRFCMAGCPYGARSFNFQDPRPSITDANMLYPTRTKGVVEKCNFCAERLVKGELPLCVEACRNGALHFGDLNDPNSEVRKLMESQPTIQRSASMGTFPNVYYII